MSKRSYVHRVTETRLGEDACFRTTIWSSRKLADEYIEVMQGTHKPWDVLYQYWRDVIDGSLVTMYIEREKQREESTDAKDC